MTKIDVYYGFLGAGKTTLIKRMITDAYKGQTLVLIENEFGEIGVDGGFLQDAGVNITEMNSGCICCSLVGDFSRALRQVEEQYHPDRILIEPSGVGKLSDVLGAVLRAELPDAGIGAVCAVVDAKKCKMYIKNFGEFFCDQIRVAHTVVLSHTDVAAPDRVEEALSLVRQYNPDAVIVSTPVDRLSGEQLFDTICLAQAGDDLLRRAEEEARAALAHHHHHHHDDDEDEAHEHHHHHHDDEDDDEHECCHHHHDDDEDEEHEHHHHHHDDEGDEDDEHECCHHHHDDEDEEHEHHHHHHGHDADEVFTSWGRETTRTYTPDQIEQVLSAFDDPDGGCGMILRAKGIVAAPDGRFVHFDYVPGEHDVRFGTPAPVGRLCVIGASLDEARVAELFGVK